MCVQLYFWTRIETIETLQTLETLETVPRDCLKRLFPVSKVSVVSNLVPGISLGTVSQGPDSVDGLDPRPKAESDPHGIPLSHENPAQP